jgi:ubiquinone/menaquinone biosynthesis C-methylase UbiE/aminoglycoside phosphotransferase (APT) family kinase protein/uncharacterized protein YbaR (Trm112 family)
MKRDRADTANPNYLVCPYCHNSLLRSEAGLGCETCRRVYPVSNSTPNFCERDEYWCNVSREKMQELNARARESGDWLQTARELIPKYLGAFEPYDRADAQFLWPINEKSRVMDAGSMWGGLTIPVAQYCGEIFAVDKTLETLDFLKIRAGQMGLTNLHVIASGMKNLPFPDGYFDMVILNGVLEWVAVEQEVVLEAHWGKKRKDYRAYPENPRRVQEEVLREIKRVLKKEGYLHLAIENRVGFHYFAGAPDEHVNLRYVPLLPRFLANFITRRKLNSEYRTYTYTPNGYRSLLKGGGFACAEFYGAFPDYHRPAQIIPEDFIKYWKRVVLPLESPNAPGYIKLAAKMFPGSLLKHVSPSIIAVAGGAEGEKQNQARVIRLLEKASLLKGRAPRDISAMKWKGRAGNYHAVNYAIYDKAKARPIYFCKICRDTKHKNILEDEARNLREIDKLLENTELNSSVPKLLYHGTIDKITLLVTQFIEGEPVNFKAGTSLSKKNLRILDNNVQTGIRFLVKFQRYTRTRDVKAAPYLLSVIEKQREVLKAKGELTGEVDTRIGELIRATGQTGGLKIPLCAVHGDADFRNIIVHNGKVSIIDFELFEREGTPFLDLAALIFNPILMSHAKLKTDIPLSDYINNNHLKGYFNKWLQLYTELSGISPRLLKYLPQIAALEQRTKKYPYYRDPETFLMYSRQAFTVLMSLEIR